MNMEKKKWSLPALIIMLAVLATGCGGNDGEIGKQLTGLGATVLNQSGSDIPATVMLSNMKGKEVDLDQALPLVAQLRQVKSVVLSSTNITDDQLAILGKMSSIVDLQLSDTGITDAGIKQISGLPKLQSLYLSGTKITAACLPDVAKLTKLTGLAIDNTAVSGGYDALHALPALELLVAGKLTITEEQAKQIVGIPKLRRLDIMGATVEGESLKILQSKLESVAHGPPEPAQNQ
jgi:Leucine-rich repeat (LRR) protein